MTSVITAGVADKLGMASFLSKGKGFTDQLTNNLVNAGTAAVISTGINGGSFEKSLQNALKEFDVNNRVPNSGRDAERFLRGSDGSVYYTNDHYGTFIKLNPKK